MTNLNKGIITGFLIIVLAESIWLGYGTYTLNQSLIELQAALDSANHAVEQLDEALCTNHPELCQEVTDVHCVDDPTLENVISEHVCREQK